MVVLKLVLLHANTVIGLLMNNIFKNKINVYEFFCF